MESNRTMGNSLLAYLRQQTNFRLLQYLLDVKRSFDPEFIEKEFYRDAAGNVWTALRYREWIGEFKDYFQAHQLDYEEEFTRRDFELWDSMNGLSYCEGADYNAWLSELENRQNFYTREKSRLLCIEASTERNEQLNEIDNVLRGIEDNIVSTRHILELEKDRKNLKEAENVFKEILQNVRRIYTTVDSYLNEGKHASLDHLSSEMLFTVAIGKISRIVNKAGIFENQLTPYDLLQVLNVNPRYSGIRFVENKKSWVISFIYLLANFYKEFEEQNSDLWAKRIVPFLGIDYSNEYLKRKKQKEKSISDGYKDFMVQLEDCLDRYNLLLKFGYDNNSRDSFMEQFSTMG